MKDNRESHPIYIAIDATKIARCKWCGTAESGEWINSKTGLYCSKDCEEAFRVGQNICGLVFVVMALMLTPLLPPVSIPFYIVIAIPTFCCLLGHIRIGQRVQQRVRRGSRRSEVSSATLLKALPSKVACPRCDANIDLRKVREDRVYACEYCGATGTIEVVKTGGT